MTIQLPPHVEQILNMLHENGFEVYIVGGAVRCALMEIQPDDFDITTNAWPEQVKRLFGHTVDVGIHHGTVGVVIDHQLVEVTTFRIEGSYSDNRRPDRVEFVEDIAADLSRRDFTVNAMAYNHQRGLVDPFGGVQDIRRGIIRTVGEPALRFGEDALRMLRAVRFCARLGFELDQRTEQGIKVCCRLIQQISAERIRVELEKILLSDNPKAAKMLKDTGLLDYFLMPLSRCFDTPQHNRHHFTDVGTHSLLATAKVPKEPVLRWAALLHDIGKPDTQTMGKDGQHHFYGHALRSVQLAREWLNALKFSNAQKHDILTLIEYHDYPLAPQPKSVRRLARLVGERLFLPLLELKRGDALAQHPDFRAEKLEQIDTIEKLYHTIQAENHALTLKDLAVDGQDLLAEGLVPDRQMGAILGILLLAVSDNPALNQKELLIIIAKKIVNIKFKGS